jgi:tetratricopeptide (TPR) repeat protein
MDSGHEIRIQIALATPAKKYLACAVCLLPLVLYVAVAAIHFQAARLSSRPSLACLESASRLDPWNDQYRALIGEYYLLIPRKPSVAATFFNSALTLNPHASRYWLDLAAAFQLLGRSHEQMAALANALAVDPRTPLTAWEAANAYTALGETDMALKAFRTVMEGAPSLQPAALRYCWRLRPDAQALLRDIIPMNGPAPAAFLELLVSKNEGTAAAEVWNNIVRNRQLLEPKDLLNYIQFLMANHDFSSLSHVWLEGTQLAGLSDYQSSPANLVVNGNFRLPILNAGLDWRYQQSSDVALALDPAQSHSGLGSLRLRFDSRGLEDGGIRQYIPVMPDARYEFSSFVKSEQLQGAGGLHFVIEDFGSGVDYFLSDTLATEGSWKPYTGEFTTGPDTRLVTLRIKRIPPGDAIRGTLWVDSVRMVQKPLAEAQP